MQWKGPFEVVERVGVTDYKVKLESGTKAFHINMLKQYFSRDDPVQTNPEADELEEVAVAVLKEETDDPLEVCLPTSIEGDRKTVSDVHISPD